MSQSQTTKPTTIARVADALGAMAEAEFASWLKEQPAEVRAMPEDAQVEAWAEAINNAP